MANCAQDRCRGSDRHLGDQRPKWRGWTAEMGNGFSLVFRAYMTPWTQECMYFILLTLSDTGISVEPDPFMRGLGLEEQWFAPWGDVMSLQHVRQPEPFVRIEFSTSGGQTVPPARTWLRPSCWRTKRNIGHRMLSRSFAYCSNCTADEALRTAGWNESA